MPWAVGVASAEAKEPRAAPLSLLVGPGADVQGQVAQVLGMPLDRVLPLARPDQRAPKLVGDLDVLLRFRGFRADERGHRDRHDCRLLHRLDARVSGQRAVGLGDRLCQRGVSAIPRPGYPGCGTLRRNSFARCRWRSASPDFPISR